MAKKLSQPMLPGMPRNRDLLSDKARYKKGYTPERQKEISNALNDTDVKFVPSKHVDPKVWEENPGVYYGMEKRAKQGVVSGFANSKVKPKHLEGLKSIDMRADDLEGAPPGSTAGGVYNWPTSKISIANAFDKNNKNRVQRSLLHELGHHVTLPALDEHVDSNPNSEMGRSDHMQYGAAEGVADNFADKNRGKSHRGAWPNTTGRKAKKRVQSGYIKKAQRGFDGAPEESDWSFGYVQGAGKEGRSKIFHSTRQTARQLELGEQ